MESLKRNENGQFSDPRVHEIETDLRIAVETILEKWSNIHPYDIEFIAHRVIAHAAAIYTVKNGQKSASGGL